MSSGEVGINAVYSLLGFRDKNRNGVIEKDVRGEKYVPQADIDGDGTIVPAEAKYFLYNLPYIIEGIREEYIAQYPLTKEEADLIFQEAWQTGQSIPDPAIRGNVLTEIYRDALVAGIK